MIHSSTTRPSTPQAASLCLSPSLHWFRREGATAKTGSEAGAAEEPCARGALLGIAEVAVAQEHLLPGLEGWHPEVGAAGAAESIAQVTLWT